MTSTDETTLDAGTLDDPPVETKTDRGTEYVVLQEIDSVEELGLLLETGDTKVYAVVGERTARDRKGAARHFAETGKDGISGPFKVVPRSSWTTYRPNMVLQLVEEA